MQAKPSPVKNKSYAGYAGPAPVTAPVMEEYANVKKQAAEIANQDGDQYRKMKEPILQKINEFIKGSHAK